MLPYKYIIIVGCGHLGSLLANRLSSLGSRVGVIDQHEQAFNRLFVEFSGFKVLGNAAELAVLRRAEIGQADCLLATTNQDNLNLMVAQVAQTFFHVPRVLAQVVDPSRETIYHRLGIETINPTQLSAEACLAMLPAPAEGERSWRLF
jgi:trk system potassium uptake protein TrkA